MGRNYEDAMSQITGETKAKRGRPTIDNGWLGGNRDALLNMFVFGWPEIGWQLSRAENRDALRLALLPLRGHPNRQYLHRLLRETKVKGEETEIRKERKLLNDTVNRMHATQLHCSECMNRCREIEAALSQAVGNQLEVLLPLFHKRRTECQSAQDGSRNANEMHLKIENQLFDKEAAYAQDELLTYILKGKYAFDPLNLANAVAGLPWAIGLPFMGVWQSHARCSKIRVPGWPSYRYVVFKTIQKAWEHAGSRSLETITKVFENTIRGLPKTIVYDDSQAGPLKIENYARIFLFQHWWWLQLAIEKTLGTRDDPRPAYFVIASNLDKLIEGPRTPADSVLAETAQIRD